MSNLMYKEIHRHINSGKQTKSEIDDYNTKENEWVFDAKGLALLKRGILLDIRNEITDLAKIDSSGMRVVNLAEIESLIGKHLIPCMKFAHNQ